MAAGEPGGVRGAKDAYQQAIAVAPGNASAYHYQGLALLRLGRLDEALAAFNRAIALDSGSAAIHCNRGYALLCLDRLDAALAAFNHAIALGSDNAATHTNRGIVLAAIGDLDQALAQFDAADRLAPDGAGEGKTWAGAILWHRRDPVRARDRFALVKGRVTEYGLDPLWQTGFLS
jgi:tetratricopeptide (TPR) repeat protein